MNFKTTVDDILLEIQIWLQKIYIDIVKKEHKPLQRNKISSVTRVVFPFFTLPYSLFYIPIFNTVVDG